MQVHTASGKIESSFEQCEKAEFDSASGEIAVTADALSELSAKTISGNVSCEIRKMAGLCALQTVSGEIMLDMPEALGFTAEIASVSGDFSSDLALKKDGKTYIYGDGSAGIHLKTTSGDMTIY